MVNNIPLDHTGAMRVWFVSNPVLMIWAYGMMQFELAFNGDLVYSKKQWWTGGMSATAVAVMYLVAFITGAYGIYIGG